jgi:hypothetical protein
MARDESLPPEPLPLTEASVQEIQLELIRRRKFNQFNGSRIVASLRHHRTIWRAVVFDRQGYATRETSGLSGMCLIKLRDLPMNYWNVDTLFVLCDDVSKAHELPRVADSEEWLADTAYVHENREELAMALGDGHPEFVVEFWWD